MRTRWAFAFALVLGSSCSLSSLDELQGGGTDIDGGAGTSGSAGKDAGQADGWACVPKTCTTAGASCGTIPDGCGETIDCGGCAAGQTCGGGGPNRCGTGPCVPETCASASAGCGEISDGCGNTIDCGACEAPETCNAHNQCECVPKSCNEQSIECGAAADGCGNALSCGNCPSGQMCDGGECVCQPKTCAALGWTCGSGSDGCGGTVQCGSCSGSSTCISNNCAVGAMRVCGQCPGGFTEQFGVSNDVCGAMTFCGFPVEAVCILNGANWTSGCDTGCPAGYHLAYPLPHCACPGSVNLCLAD